MYFIKKKQKTKKHLATYSLKPQQQPSADSVSHTLRWPPPDNPMHPTVRQGSGGVHRPLRARRTGCNQIPLNPSQPPSPVWERGGGHECEPVWDSMFVRVSPCVCLWGYICPPQTVRRTCGCKVASLTEAAGLEEQQTSKAREAHPPETSNTQVRHTAQIHVNTPYCSRKSTVYPRTRLQYVLN